MPGPNQIEDQTDDCKRRALRFGCVSVLGAMVLCASTGAFAQSASVVDTALKSKAGATKAVRTFDDDALSSSPGRLSHGAVEQAAPPAPAQISAPAAEGETTAPASATDKAAITPEQLKALLAHRDSLEGTIKQINDEIEKAAEEPSRREVLEAMRSNAEANLKELMQTLEEAQKQKTASPAETPKPAPETEKHL